MGRVLALAAPLADKGSQLVADVSAEIIAVGSELLLGDGVDTNSAFISARLAEVGVDVYRHVTVGDNDRRMLAALREATERADAVIVTGGLGPTQDDRTRDAVATLAGVDLVRSDDLVSHIEGHFARRGRVMSASNLRQADLPAGARVLAPVGTAAGFVLEVAKARVYCLPGVPAEMRPMLEHDVLPELTEAAGGQATVSRLVRTAGMAESEVAERCGDLVERLEATGNPTLAFLASRGETRVRITGKAATRDEALALLEPVVAEVVERLGPAVAGLDDEATEHGIARLLVNAGWRLAVGESVTGGAVGGRLVGVAGASGWFQGGLTAYTPAAKTALVGVTGEALDRHGTVSEHTAAALAQGTRTWLSADVGLGVVGVAGPTAPPGVEVGTVCLAVDLPGTGTRTRTVTLPGRGREAGLEFATSAALDYLRRSLVEAVVV